MTLVLEKFQVQKAASSFLIKEKFHFQRFSI